jgi:hypothetical protein
VVPIGAQATVRNILLRKKIKEKIRVERKSRFREGFPRG